MACNMKLKGCERVPMRQLVMVVILCCAFAHTYVCAQTDFISIDCGAESNYVNPSTGISYVTDAAYISTGINANVANLDGVPIADRTSSTLRYFPDQRSKYCYSLPVKAGTRYLLRVSFYHGGYDGSSPPVSFGMSVDTTYASLLIESVKFSMELVGLTLSDKLSFCLMRVNPKETPFISSLEYRPLESFMYPGQDGDALNYVLATNARYHFRSMKREIRYPDDVYDRTWLPYAQPLDSTVTAIETTQAVSTTSFLSPNLPPSAVMQGALTSLVNSTLSVCVPISFTSSKTPGVPSSFYLSVHVAEIQEIAAVQPRIFNVSWDGGNIWFRGVQPLAAAKSLYSSVSFGGYKFSMAAPAVCVALQAEESSVLGPLINAIELYTLFQPRTPPLTNDSDSAKVEDLKTSLNLTDWTGDPCLPVPYNWLTCSKDEPPTVETVILSNYGTGGSISTSIYALFNLTTLYLDGNALTGEIPDLSSLVNLRKLHLQNNSLSGVIPESLANIPLLEELFLENNNLSGEVPAALLQKSHLTFRYFGNPSLCRNTSCPIPPSTPTSRPNKWKIPVGAAGGGLVLLLLIALAVWCCKWKKKHDAQDYNPVHELYPNCNDTTAKKFKRDLDIVFVHGLQLASAPDAWAATWTNENGVCWPRDWLPHDESLHGLRMRVLAVSYNAHLSGHMTGKFGRTANGHRSISNAMFHALVKRWSVGKVPFVLVGHCYGGLVIKSLVVYCNQNADDEDAKSFMRNLRGVVSYGVPHRGSELASIAIRASSCLPLRLSKGVSSLKPFNEENQYLSEQFRIAIQNPDLPVRLYAFAEQLEINRVILVPAASAQGSHRDINFMVLQQTDHYSMCKPNTKDAESYSMFINFLVNPRIIAADPALEGPLVHEAV